MYVPRRRLAASWSNSAQDARIVVVVERLQHQQQQRYLVERICSSYTPFLIALNPMTIPAQILVRIHTFENKKLQPVPGEYRLNSRSEFKFDPRQATSVLFLFCFDF